MGTVFVDNRRYEVNPDQSLLQACLSLGLDLPYFCWHPALGSVGACRQCAVKQYRNEQDTKGKLVMACMTPAADGTRISIRDPESTQFRAAIIEGLMLSHPHDCPVCDEGGECHLQDMTVMTGHDYRRYSFAKRVFRNQDLGPFLNHEMNRCIQCYRCVRYYREYAGGLDLNAFSMRNLVYFGRHEDGPLENEFSGNLVEVCPTGVFTDGTLGRHYTRKWDLQFAPSICVHCGVGCNTSPAERYGTLRRIVNRYNAEVNGYFICDRGRFGYEFVNSPRRARLPLRQQGNTREQVSASEAVNAVAAILRSGTRVIGIGSPRASLEANFALRALVGDEDFYAGISDAEHDLLREATAILRYGTVGTPGVREIESCDAVLVLGEDLTATAPRVALALRQSVRQQPMDIAKKLRIPLWLDHAVREAIQDARGPMFVATPLETRLDEVATETWRAQPEDLARLGFAVAHKIDPLSPAPDGVSPALDGLADRIASALKSARKPLVISGPSCGSVSLLHAAANIARALRSSAAEPQLGFVAHECNSMGLVLMEPKRLGGALRLAADGDRLAVVVLENDLYRRAGRAEVDRLLAGAPNVVAIDHLENPTTLRAGIVLPAGTFAEGDGTFVSSEGRAQRFFQVFVPAAPVQESWRWLRDIAVAAGRMTEGSWSNLDDVIAALSREMPQLAPIREAAPASDFRLAGEKVPREPHRYSGRTAMHANVSVHEPKPPADPDSPLSFSMEGYPDQPPPALVPFFWAPGWNSIQSVNKFQSEILGPLHGGNPGVRLISPSGTKEARYFADAPGESRARPGELLFVPRYRLFGSDELSSCAPAVAERTPQPSLELSCEDMAALGVVDGKEVEFEVSGTRYRLPVRSSPGLEPGMAGVPVGFDATAGVQVPAWGRVI